MYQHVVCKIESSKAYTPYTPKMYDI